MKYITLAAIAATTFIAKISTAQTGDLWFGWPGAIAVKPAGKIHCWPTESPDHPDHLHLCKIEWWTIDTVKSLGIVGNISGNLGYTDCTATDTLVFEWPKHDSIYVRKRVYWQTPSGGRWATTKQHKIYNPCQGCK